MMDASIWTANKLYVYRLQEPHLAATAANYLARLPYCLDVGTCRASVVFQSSRQVRVRRNVGDMHALLEGADYYTTPLTLVETGVLNGRRTSEMLACIEEGGQTGTTVLLRSDIAKAL